MTIARRVPLTLPALLAAGSLALAGSSVAYARDHDVGTSSDTPCLSSEWDRYGIDSALLCKVVSVGTHIHTSDDGKALTTDLADEQLVSVYGFTPAQVTDFHAILGGTYTPPQPTTKVYPDRARFYISNADLTAGTFAVLGAAAASGPEALAAAFVGLSSVMGGPIGTALSAGVSVLGIGFFAALATKITGAIVQGKGIAFYTQWDFPPVRAEIE